MKISDALKAEVDTLIAQALPDAIAFRHERHRSPELTWHEEGTAKAVAARLAKIDGVTIQRTDLGRFGVVALIEGAEPGPTVALRADMDALPIREETGCAYASQNPGVHHACGHDGHMANLLGSAQVLARLRGKLRGRVKLIFQPAEEGGHGGRVLCDEGVLEAPKVDAIFGLHGWPELPVGRVWVRSGPMMASTTMLKLVVRGKGCHAAMPHLGTDQILIAARIIEALQMVSSRHMAPTDPVALSITQVNAGTALNVLPPTVEMKGTLRTMTYASRDKAMAQIEKLAKGIAEAHGATVELELLAAYPPTVNDDAATRFVEAVARDALGASNVDRMPVPTMGGEDFSYYLERVPGCFFFLGVDDGRKGGYPGLHHPAFDFNDKALTNGMRVFTHAALGYAAWAEGASLQ